MLTFPIETEIVFDSQGTVSVKHLKTVTGYIGEELGKGIISALGLEKPLNISLEEGFIDAN